MIVQILSEKRWHLYLHVEGRVINLKKENYRTISNKILKYHLIGKHRILRLTL